MRAGDEEKRIAVRGCPNGRLGADRAASSWSVIDDKWLAESLLQPLCHRACKNVAHAAGRKGDYDAHRLRRIGLRSRQTWYGRQCGSAYGQMPKLSAGKFHWITPSSPRRVSFDLGARKSHDLAPLLGFVSNEPCEIGWRAGRQNGPQLGKPSGDFGISQRCVDVLVQLGDNLGGC